MKSVTSARPCRPALAFPKLMVGNGQGSIGRSVVFFGSRSRGIVVHDTNGYHKVGNYSRTWNMDHFEDYTGSVCLEN